MNDCNAPTRINTRWSLKRTIQDNLSDSTYSGVGRTILEAVEDDDAENRYKLDEQGLLSAEGVEHKFSGRYWLTLVPESRQLQIYHHDQTPFLVLPYAKPLEARWQVEHYCGDDHYQGWIERKAINDHPFGLVKVLWRVKGPKKDYEMYSEFELLRTEDIH